MLHLGLEFNSDRLSYKDILNQILLILIFITLLSFKHEKHKEWIFKKKKRPDDLILQSYSIIPFILNCLVF